MMHTLTTNIENAFTLSKFLKFLTNQTPNTNIRPWARRAPHAPPSPQLYKTGIIRKLRIPRFQKQLVTIKILGLTMTNN